MMTGQIAREFWSYTEVAARTGLTVDALRARVHRGALPFVKIGKRVLIHDVDLERILGDVQRKPR